MSGTKISIYRVIGFNLNNDPTTEVTVSHISPHFTYRQIKQENWTTSSSSRSSWSSKRKACPRHTVTMCRAYSCSVRRKSTGYNRSTEQGASLSGQQPRDTSLKKHASGRIRRTKREKPAQEEEEQGPIKARPTLGAPDSTRHEAWQGERRLFLKPHPLWLSCVLERRKIYFHLHRAGTGNWTTFKQSFLFSLHLNTRCGGAYNQILCGTNPCFYILNSFIPKY